MTAVFLNIVIIITQIMHGLLLYFATCIMHKYLLYNRTAKEQHVKRKTLRSPMVRLLQSNIDVKTKTPAS